MDEEVSASVSTEYIKPKDPSNIARKPIPEK